MGGGGGHFSSQAEQESLQSLRRGVFAARDIVSGSLISTEDIYSAFPCQKGQIHTDKLSKYVSLYAGKSDIKKDAPLMTDNILFRDKTPQIKDAVVKIIDMLRKSGVVVPVGSLCEISHHYGIEHFAQTGVAMIDCVNREYCKKILVLLPGQSHPFHYHNQKEETFLVVYGSMKLLYGDKEFTIGKGESFTIERGVNHAFSSENGCVFEEISTTHFANDSFYQNADSFTSPRKTKVYLTKEYAV